MDIRREYSRCDLEACGYLTVTTLEEWEGGEFSSTGPLELLLSGRGKKRSFAQVGRNKFVVSGGLRRTLEQAGLRRTVFRETRLTDGYDPVKRMSYSWEEAGGEPWWQLTSDLTLPWLSARCTLADRNGEPFKENGVNGCWLVEGFYHPAEMHYRRGDLAKVGEFDVALTQERFGNSPANAYPAVVVSQRAYRLIREQDRKAVFVPVRIDEE